jgi:hypothetical protein
MAGALALTTAEGVPGPIAAALLQAIRQGLAEALSARASSAR